MGCGEQVRGECLKLADLLALGDASVPLSGRDWSKASVGSFVRMSFEPCWAVKALATTDGNRQAASEWILGNLEALREESKVASARTAVSDREV